MEFLLKLIPRSITAKLVLTVSITLFASLGMWAWMNIKHQRAKAIENIIQDADRLSKTVQLGSHYAMLHNLRNDISLIINGLADERFVSTIRIFNKEGVIKYSSDASEIETPIPMDEKGKCRVCHQYMPPLADPDLEKRSRIFESEAGFRFLEVLSPIKNEPGCSSSTCHYHQEDEVKLGILDVVVSLQSKEQEITEFEERVVLFALAVFVFISVLTAYVVITFIKRPVMKLVDRTRDIGNGEYIPIIDVDQDDELGRLAESIRQMGREIQEKTTKLNRQRNEYQALFELVPCLITVQDRDYKIVQYNKEFAEKFHPSIGDYCYCAYKNRKEKCDVCPVEKTFEDGRSHYSEEAAFNKNGEPTYWVVKTSPIKNEHGETVAAMEMSLDITRMKLLEEMLEKSEKKYYAIFDNIPNAVFVLNLETLEILDCNQSVEQIYGYEKKEIIGKPFMSLFNYQDAEQYEVQIKSEPFINQATHFKKNGERIYVGIRLSPLEYPGMKVLLVTTSDITKRLEAEQQLIQASKMTTLGEMATGIAHELNQPLTVIKTASSFLMRKIRKKEDLKPEILATMAEEMDSHVDRATKIINHIRQFGRKSDVTLEKVDVNAALHRTLDILGQQLKVRGIRVIWEEQPDLPLIMGDVILLEQVFINLIMNARDAIEDKRQSENNETAEEKITIQTGLKKGFLWIDICDTGGGIPEPYLDRIFEPFFTTKKVGSGTGLGLSISYSIITDCKGTLHARSVDRQGACFTITFPIPNEHDE